MNKGILLFAVVALLSLWSGCHHENNYCQMKLTEINKGWSFRQAGKEEWLPANVPGTVHTDLMQNNKIDDPFYRLNEHDIQWIDKVNWEYKTTFNADENLLQHDRVQLEFKGLDTYAEVFLNDIQVLAADNMFREWVVDIKPQLNLGSNELRILFRSPINEGIIKYDSNEYIIPVSDNDLAEIGKVKGGKKVSIYTRKAGYHFGWDWGPRLVTSGIWRSVYLKAWNEARIENIQVIQHNVDSTLAQCTVNMEIESMNAGPGNIVISCEGKKLAHSTIHLKAGISNYAVDFEIENPRLWWTNGLGDQPLYTIQAKLTAGKSIAEASERIGLRTLELVRDKDESGTSFYFRLNGVPVFMKGANYIPNDAFLPRVSEANYNKVIETAQASNMNMLRVWGGGIYENDIFYDLCDEAGILVWQDFMFACAMFPGDEAFLENVKQEAIDNIKRLRNHPSIALWCGNNEILAAWYEWGWKEQAEAKSWEDADQIWEAYENIFHRVLPETVKNYDPTRAYWSSSPSSGTGITADMINGDAHYWGVWWGKEPFKSYETNIARFMSEYGFQSFPELKTVMQYALPEDYQIDSEVMNSHQRSSIGNKTIEYYMLQDYQEPKDFESFLYVNHVLQAEGIKFALEGHRRAMPFCMGSLYWQINDCWPVASWSSTDYYQRWKALQYFVKKGFEPVLLSPHMDGDDIKIGVVNDKLEAFSGELKMQIIDFEGNIVWDKSVLANIPENSSNTYFGMHKADLLQGMDARNHFLRVELIVNKKLIADNALFFLPVKELNLPYPMVEYDTRIIPGGFEITLFADKLAKNLYMSLGDEEGFFSDNYFDLLPESKVSVQLTTDISEEILNKVLTIRTLDGAF